MVLETSLKLAAGRKCFVPFNFYASGNVSKKMCFESGKEPSSWVAACRTAGWQPVVGSRSHV